MMEEITNDDFERVIRQRHDDDHFLVKVTEEGPSKCFPPGTRSWIVEHESRTCKHTPPCHWFGRMYCYRGRLTLIKDMEMPFITLIDLIERVTGAKEN